MFHGCKTTNGAAWFSLQIGAGATVPAVAGFQHDDSNHEGKGEQFMPVFHVRVYWFSLTSGTARKRCVFLHIVAKHVPSPYI
jgi:hypothetical protein